MVLGFSSYFFSFPPLNFNFCNKRYVCWSFPPRPQHRGLSQPEPRARRRPDLSLPPAAAGALARHHTGGPAAPPPPPVGDFSLPLPTTSPLPMAAVDPLEGRTITRQVSTATPTRSCSLKRPCPSTTVSSPVCQPSTPFFSSLPCLLGFLDS